jgi:hypothetical protein
VLHGDAAQSREYLAFLLWPESSESQARTNLAPSEYVKCAGPAKRKGGAILPTEVSPRLFSPSQCGPTLTAG